MNKTSKISKLHYVKVCFVKLCNIFIFKKKNWKNCPKVIYTPRSFLHRFGSYLYRFVHRFLRFFYNLTYLKKSNCWESKFRKYLLNDKYWATKKMLAKEAIFCCRYSSMFYFIPCFTLFHVLRKQLFIQIVKIVALTNIVIHIFPAWQIYRTWSLFPLIFYTMAHLSFH